MKRVEKDMKLYYNGDIRALYIVEGSKQITVDLPKELSEAEIANVISSDTLRSIIEQITNSETHM